MPLRSLAPLALALGAVSLACKPSIPKNSNPAFLDYAVLDPSAAPPAIPTPNDLALLSAATTPGAQGDLLRALATAGCPAGQSWPACGGFPSDQEVPITFGVVRVAMNGTPPAPAPDLDPTGIRFCPGTDCNLLLLRLDSGTPVPLGAGDVALEYTTSGTQGTLAIRNRPHADHGVTATRSWPAGARYLAAIRGGTSGIPTRAGLQPQPTVYLLLQGKNLADPANQGPLPGSAAEKAAAGAQLEALRQFYASPPHGAPPSTPSTFQLIDSTQGGLGFPLAELADLTTFNVATSSGTFVIADASAGVVPFPSDLLLDASTGHVAANPAFCQGAFDQASPPSCPLSRALSTLDGFSTTGMVLATLSGPVQASTIGSETVFLFELSASGPRRLVDVVRSFSVGGPAEYLTEPPLLVQSGATTAVGLQPALDLAPPAVPVQLDLPPLKEATEYAVIITNGVKDLGGAGLVRSTLATTLLLPDPLFTGGRSQLAGVSDAQAQGLEAMRQAVAMAVAALPSGLGAADVAMAYTFKTQSITEPALELAAIPYVGGLPDAPVAVSSLTIAAAAAKYGLPAGLLDPSVDHVAEATVVTYDLLDPATGAFHSDPTQGTPLSLSALIAVPKTPAPAGGAPLVIFHHGITRGRGDALLVATALNAAGMVVAAIDADKHGDRAACSAIHLMQGATPVFFDVCSAGAPCTNAPDLDCAADSTCVPDPAQAGQADTKPSGPGIPTDLPDAWPGVCKKRSDGTAGALAYEPLATATGWDGTGGTPLASGNYFASGNLFRTRDAIRQDVIDESALVRALTSAAGQAVVGYAIDPARVFFLGHSLGAIEGTVDLAVNPRFSRAVLTAGGGTLADVFFTSPSFADGTRAILAAQGITSQASPAFLQFVNVAKWVLDPADPVNFARHVVTAPLPNPLDTSGTPAAMAAKAVLGQAARCDDVVPNANNALLGALLGLTPVSPLESASAPSLQWFTSGSSPCIPGETTGGAPHSFLFQSATAQGEVVKFFTGQPVAATPLVP